MTTTIITKWISTRHGFPAAPGRANRRNSSVLFAIDGARDPLLRVEKAEIARGSSPHHDDGRPTSKKGSVAVRDLSLMALGAA
jgi:hypothetical protein